MTSHLLHSALFLNLALSQFLQQNQLRLLDSQFFFQLLDDLLPFLRGTLLRVSRKSPRQATQRSSISPNNIAKKSSGDKKKIMCVLFTASLPTISLSVSLFVRQWPFMTGLDGSLSDSTITSSGDGGCLSFLIRLETKQNNKEFIFSKTLSRD